MHILKLREGEEFIKLGQALKATGLVDSGIDAKDVITQGLVLVDGEIETNTGDIIGKKNSTLDDATITGGINWYFKTVSVLNDDGELTDGSELLITDDTSEE